MRLPRRGSRAFTLLELIVSLVVLALLAALALPTLESVVTRSDDEVTRTEVSAFLRDGVANARLGSASVVSAADLATAASEVHTSYAGAATTYQLVSGASDHYADVSSSAATGADAADLTTSVAMLTRRGNCVMGTVAGTGAPVVTVVAKKDVPAAGCLAGGGAHVLDDCTLHPESCLPPPGPPVPDPTLTCGDSRVDLTWGLLADATGYQVWRDGHLLDADVQLPYEDVRVTNGTAYTYYVVAYDDDHTWTASDALTCTPHSPVPDVPAAPAGHFSAEPYTYDPEHRVMHVAWRPVLRASSYRVYVDGVLRATTTGTTYDFDHETVNTPYSVTVSAVSDGGESAQSDPTVLLAPLNAPAAPRVFVKGTSATSVDVGWSVVGNADAYRLYRDGVFVAQVGHDPWHDSMSRVVGGLTPQTTYDFEVTAVNSAGEGDEGSASATTDALSHCSGSCPGPTPGPGPGPAPTPHPKPGPPCTGPDCAEPDAYDLRAHAVPTSVALTWDAQPGATSYDVYRDNELLDTVTDPSDLDLDVYPETTYTYFVQGVTSGGVLDPSETVSVTVPDDPGVVVPDVPLSLKATPGDSSATLTWRRVAHAAGYRVYLDGVLADALAPSSDVLRGLTNGVTYTVTVSAYNDAGESAQSDPVDVTPQASTPTCDGCDPSSVPPTPAAFDAELDGLSVDLSWDAASGATGYRVYEDGVLVDQKKSTSVTESPTPGTTSSWSVSAYNSAGESAQTDPVSVSVPAAPPVLAGSPRSATSAKLGWTQDGVVTGWTLYRDGVAVAAPTRSPFAVTGLTPGQAYSFALVAHAATGDSDPSNTVVVTPVGPPAPPAGLVLTASSTRVTASWTAVTPTAPAPVTGYELFTSSGRLLAASATTTASFAASPSTTYTAFVASYGPGGTSAGSDEASVTTPPAAPTGLQAVVDASAGGVGTLWQPVRGATSYSLERDGAVVYSGPVTSFSDTTADTTTAHTYRVRALGAGGWGDYSTPTTQVALPAAPVLAGTSGYQVATLSWTMPSGASGNYRVYRATAGTSGYVLAKVTASRTWSDLTVENGITYTYWVTASNVAGEGASSNHLPLTPNIAAPTAPTSVKATVAGPAWKASVTWSQPTKGSPVTGFTIFKGATPVGTASADATSFTDPTALGSGETAVYSVRADGTGGSSLPTKAPSVFRPTPPPAPTGLTGTALDSTLGLAWTAVTSSALAPLTGYHVYLDGVLSATVSTPSATLTGLTDGHAYAVAVTSYGTGGESGAATTTLTPTDGAIVTLPNPTSAVDPTAPGGLFEWYGDQLVNSDTGAWVNPTSAAAGLISTSYSIASGDYLDGSPAATVDRSTSTAFGSPTAIYGSSMTFKLATPVALVPTGVYASFSGVMTLSGLNPQGAWVTLATLHSGTVSSVSTTTGYSAFRFNLTKAGSRVNTVELYGALYPASAGSVTKPTATVSLSGALGLKDSAYATVSGVLSSGGLPVSGYHAYVDGVLAGTTIGASTPDVLATSLSPGTHTLAVSAFNALGDGPRSSPVTVTTQSPTCTGWLVECLTARYGANPDTYGPVRLHTISGGSVTNEARAVDLGATTTYVGSTSGTVVDLGGRVAGGAVYVETQAKKAVYTSLDGSTWVLAGTTTGTTGDSLEANQPVFRYVKVAGTVREVDASGDYYGS